MAKRGHTFRVRLNCVDHYQNPPTSLDPPLWGPLSASSSQRSKLPLVPVIRVFGATETGQKVCAHIHGAFPYLYVPYTDPLEKDHVEKYISTFSQSIDHALALSYRRNHYSNPRDSRFVAHISLVKGVPFFGYSVGYKHYLKIYLLNPLHMTRFADLLHSGAIMQRVFQPYEAHLQYLLQWMCDFNLYGCALIDVDAAKCGWRSPVPAGEGLDESRHLWHDRSIDKSQMLDEDQFPRQSHCQLELDIRVEDIQNRLSVRPRELHHSFVERLSSLENLPPEEKFVHSMAGLWKDETRRRKLNLGITDPSSSPFPPEVLVSMSADPRNDSRGGWIHEEEFREAVYQLAEQERGAKDESEMNFENFMQQKPEENGVQTVLESVAELFQDNIIAKSRTRIEFDQADDFNDGLSDQIAPVDFSHGGEALVDINVIRDDDDDYGSDEDIARTLALSQRQKLEKGDFDRAMSEPKDNGQVAEFEDHSMKRPTHASSQGPFKQTKTTKTGGERPPSRHVTFRVRDIRPKTPSTTNVDDYGPPQGIEGPKSTYLNALDAVPSGQPAPSSQHSSQSQSSQSNRLGFPVVKNAKEPSVSRRPSQQDDQCGVIHKRTRQEDGLAVSSDDSSKLRFKLSTGTVPTLSKTPSQPAASPLLGAKYVAAFGLPAKTDVFVFGLLPPSFEEVEATVTPSVIYQDAYYSNEKDVPERPREYAGQEFRLESNSLPYLPDFDRKGREAEKKSSALGRAKEEQLRRRQCTLRAWEIMQAPPSWDEVQEWLDGEKPAPLDELYDLEVDSVSMASRKNLKRKNRAAPELSQIDGPTQKNKHGFKYSQHNRKTVLQNETGYMSTMSLEVHVNTRGDLAADPERDEVTMVVWCLQDGTTDDEDGNMGIVVLAHAEDEDLPDRIRRIVGHSFLVEYEETELDLLNRMVDIVRHLDPDILTGFEVHNGSWGYLIERARLQYEFNLPDEFSRMKSQSHGRFGKDADRWGFTHTSTVRITGRHTLNIWRAMRSELNLLQYTMENVVFHLLHQRIPHYSFATLTRWFRSKKARELKKVLEYFISRTKLDLEILNANELIPRTSEQARLLGVDFFSVFSRGSQFKVESLMFRIAKPESFVLASPSRKQVGSQNALECLPLVMEPQSAFYNSPLLVLDFQSLYPSVMIAYNYCYSTCLGRIVNWRGTNKLGFSDVQRPPGLLDLVKDKLNIAPNGLMYVKPEMRKSLLAKMLGEILETRVMVKSGMKVDKDDKMLQQLLNNRQLALKLIANVTYGYTSASFSGRMPCSEIADSIVQTGRETLEKAIALIHSVERWGAEVVYGDTDSLFVYLKGRTRADAFKIGDEIAKAVTDTNPRPVKLKFEKVYHPCVLLAKKRYVGFKYESPDQTEPEFDAKGIETVRRDGTPAEQKIEEKALKLLFRTSDLSEVKGYFQAQCTKIMTGRVSVQDFCFAKEVKLGMYAEKGPPPPGALIATKRMLRDPRTEPQYGERVPYVVIAGAPGARLWERCVEPERLIYDEDAELDAEYYISKNIIPPLERIFNLVGANVRQWYDEMPKVQRIRMVGGARDAEANGKNKRTMENYMGSSLCLVCRSKLPSAPSNAHVQEPQSPLCTTCREERPQFSLLSLRQKLMKIERKARDIRDVCRSCAGLVWDDEVKCDSRDCPVFYSRVKADTQLEIARNGIGSVLRKLEDEVASVDALAW